MARNFHRKRGSHPIADLNVTNMIDLGFILLVIFMIAASVIREEQTIPVSLPVQSAQPQPKPDPKDRFETIAVQANGAILLNGQPYTVRQLAPELAKFAAEPRQPVIQLRCDAKTSMQQIVTVLDELQKHNLTRIAFPTEIAR